MAGYIMPIFIKKGKMNLWTEMNIHTTIVVTT